MNELSMHESWTHGVCERCLRNSHERVRMEHEPLVSGNQNDRRAAGKDASGYVWVCPVCGFCRGH